MRLPEFQPAHGRLHCRGVPKQIFLLAHDVRPPGLRCNPKIKGASVVHQKCTQHCQNCPVRADIVCVGQNQGQKQSRANRRQELTQSTPPRQQSDLNLTASIVTATFASSMMCGGMGIPRCSMGTDELVLGRYGDYDDEVHKCDITKPLRLNSSSARGGRVSWI